MLEWSLANLLAWAVQAAAIVALGVWLPMRLRLGAPRARLALFRALLVACIAMPLAQPWTPSPIPAAPVEAAPPRIELTPGGGNPPNSAASAPAGAPADWSFARVRSAAAALPWAWIALVVLVAGAVLRLAWLGLGLLSLARLRRSSSSIDADSPAVAEAARAVGACASFRQSPRVRYPVTFGLRRPVVLVPPGFTALEPPQQLAIACHELLHVRRQDWLRALGDEVVRALLWFHPAIWWLVEQIRLSAEQLIDREVVGLIGDRRSYLRALLALAEAGAGQRFRPAPCFLDHGHLQKRVAMLMEEVTMSRLRLVVSAALVFAILVTGGWAVVRAFPLQAAAVVSQLPPPPPPPPIAQVTPAPPPPPPPPPAPAASKVVTPATPVTPAVPASPQQPPSAPRPGMTTTMPEPDAATLRQRIQLNPTDTVSYFLLARLYEKAGDLAKAEATLEAAVKAAPGVVNAYLQLAGFHNRNGNFDKTMDALMRRASIEPGNPEAYHTMAAYYWEKAYRDTALTEAQKREYIDLGLRAEDQALALNPDYVDALVYKNLLLRSQALLESDPAVQKTLIAEADKLRDQAIAIRKARVAANPAPPTTSPAEMAQATAAFLDSQLADAKARLAILEQRFTENHPDVARMRQIVRDLEAKAQMAAAASAASQYGAPPPPPPPPPPPAPKKVLTGADIDIVGAAVIGVSLPPPPPKKVTIDGAAQPGRGGETEGAPYRPGDGGVKPPVVISEVRPSYTQEARQAQISGTVVLSCVVGIEGTVTDATVTRSLDSGLDEQAIIAARQWRFQPGTKDGKPVPVQVTIELTFTWKK